MEEIKTGVFKVNGERPIFIVGDIHGDYQCLVHCLVDLCNVASIKTIESDVKFNENLRECLEWNKSNNSIVVFCGDLIHRKRFPSSVLDDECSDIYIIKTLLRLKKNAKRNNGDIVIISGNHEIMNIVDPTDNTYTSKKNINHNYKYFTNHEFINKFIANTYAWVKINDILIAHGGLCSDYLKFLDGENLFDGKKIFGGGGASNKKKLNLINNQLEIESEIPTHIMIGGSEVKVGDDVVSFINDKYRTFFNNYSKSKSKTDPIGFKLFIEYDFSNKNAHNLFWCRQWGYSGINCDNFNSLIGRVGCNKMIVAHCPQFLADDVPKMINFECAELPNILISNNDSKTNGKTNNNIMCSECNSDSERIIKYKIARVDLGMSRSFEYNNSDDFFKFLNHNYNRKMSVLKLSWDEKASNYYFNYNSVITEKISCIQYLLLKYGMRKKEWDNIGIDSDWLGFTHIENILENINDESSKEQKCENFSDSEQNALLCLLYPLFHSKPNLKSVEQFNMLVKK